jgi:ubiquinone/menaquinone biosynthesis C-methylase UbiE
MSYKIWYLWNHKQRELKSLIRKITGVGTFSLTKKATDSEILKSLISSKNYDSSKNKQYARWKIIRESLSSSSIRVKTYMDFGGGDCEGVKFIGKKLKLQKQNCICADVDEWVEDKNLSRDESNYTFTNVSNTHIDHPDNYFDLITVFHVLHHIPNNQDTFNELVRVLKPNGIIILREHDNPKSKTPEQTYLIDVEHMLWSIVVRKNTYENYTETYYGDYKDEQYWKNRFHKDFDFKWSTPARGLTRSFYHVYIKKKIT